MEKEPFIFKNDKDNTNQKKKWITRKNILMATPLLLLCLYYAPFAETYIVETILHQKPHIRPGNRDIKNPYGLQGEQRLPQVLVIGVRKAGTRALLSNLMHHPDIRAANAECHFFGGPNYRQGLEFYRKLMPYSLPNQITIEKTPNYFHTPEAAKRIKEMNSTIKLIVVVREPAKRAESDYWQFEWRNHNETRTFRECALNDKGKVISSYGPVFRSNYYHILKNYWLPHFNLSQILVVNGDALGHENPGKEMRRVQEFMGVRTVITEDSVVFNKEKNFYCFKVNGKARCLGDNKGRKIHVAKENTEEILRRYYELYNKRLFKLIGHDFGWNNAKLY